MDAAWCFLHAGELRKEKMHSILTTYHSFASYLTDTDDEPCCNRTNIALGCRCEADAETDADAKRLLKTDDDDDTIHTTASPLISTDAEAEAEAKQGHGQEGGSIDTVHIVWMNHLDVGFTNNIASVLNIYWHEYFPKAIQTAKEVRANNKHTCNTTQQQPIFCVDSCPELVRASLSLQFVMLHDRMRKLTTNEKRHIHLLISFSCSVLSCPVRR
jgi:hypothetical protein